MKINNLTYIFIISALIGCKKTDNTIPKRTTDTVKSEQQSKNQIAEVPIDHQKSDIIDHCNIDNALKIIIKLPEVQKESKFVDSIFSGKKRLSFMTDSLEINDTSYYMIKTGFNGELHWETYTTFFIDKNNCKKILVDEVVSGDAIPLEEWRATHE